MALTFEWLNSRNVDEIHDIVYKEFEKDLKFVWTNGFNPFKSVLEKKIPSYVSKMDYALIKVDEVTVGVIGYYLPKEDTKAAWLGWFVIKPFQRGQGLGQRSLNLMKKYITNNFPQLDVLRVYTDADNPKTIGFYERSGAIQEPGIYRVGDEQGATKVLNFPLKPDGNYSDWGKPPIL